MFSFLGGRRAAANREVIERLHAAVVQAARQPAFYLAGEVPDTFTGRFELLVLHAALLVRRLRALPAPAPALAQDVVDALFRHLDPALREAGVGDLAVPKRMKKLVEAFLGRSMAYEAALVDSDPGALAGALSRNVYAGAAGGEGLAPYVRAVTAGLEARLPADFLAGNVAFPDPAVFLPHTAEP